MSYIDKRSATIFCDIDGTLVVHSKPTDAQLPTHKLDLLEGTIEKLLEWDKLGYNIILTTGRKESLRRVTCNQLEKSGIIYDQLIMGIGGGKRYLINDRKFNGNKDYAMAINLDRNEGIKKLNL
tara:strand:+ start:156 stop:527 length:372 start_codon:yes stop_codon:yes gene_type:complete